MARFCSVACAHLALAVVLLLHDRAAAWVKISKPCAEGCEKRGNCNQELGVCECPYGWSGPTCNVPLLNSCRTSGKESAVVALYGPAWPKPCECFQQLKNVTCDEHHCYQYTTNVWFGVKCYVRKGVPPDQQFTDFPSKEEIDAGKVEWYRGHGPPGGLQRLDSMPADWTFQDQDHLPLDACKDRCNERGACTTGRKLPGNPASICRCFKGHTGEACEETDWVYSCMNKCSGRGNCVGGFCHCERGWWGMDCSRSVAWGPDPKEERQGADKAYNRTHIRIYRYELPWHIAFPSVMDENTFTYDFLYGAFELFFEQLSGDWVTRTENPYEANLFYVPLLMYYIGGNVSPRLDGPIINRALAYIKQTYPVLWSRNKGKDHVVWIPGDLAGCFATDALSRAPIRVMHWGYQLHGSGLSAANVTHPHTCSKYERDVVVPPRLNLMKMFEGAEAVYQDAMKVEHKRPHLLFFGGTIRGAHSHYSGGARQRFHEEVIKKLKPPPDVLKFGGPSEEEGYRAHFCFIPWGNGWGNRIMFAMQQACIPVIVQDLVHQPYDEVMRYERFAVRVRHQDIPDILDILKDIGPETRAAMRAEMYTVYRGFNWWPQHGGTAYNWTIKALHHKLYNLWGMHYK